MKTTGRKRIGLARFHDGTAKANWGGRGTSLALAGLIARLDGVAEVVPINGTFITQPFGDFNRLDKVQVRFNHARRHGFRYRTAPIQTRPFLEAERYADRVIASAPTNARAARLLDAISQCDEVWMNGEGDFIMRQSGTLWRTLLIMWIALKQGKKVALVNSILSPDERNNVDPNVRDAVRSVLAHCEFTQFRDPTSSALAAEWFPENENIWLPDALFAWSDGWDEASARRSYSPEAEGLPLSVQRLIHANERIVTISGSSVMRNHTGRREHSLSELVGEIRGTGQNPVFAATSDEDNWWESACRTLDVPFVPARLPLRSGMTLLAASTVFVSGRYHPSILSACVGTPIVLFGSNSHKTTSLFDVLGMTGTCYATLDTSPVQAGLTEAVLRAAAESDHLRPEIAKRARLCHEATATGLERAGS